MKIIVLKSSKYREKDLIYSVISSDRAFSFKVKGGADVKSPYIWMNNPLTMADIELVEGKYKYPVLKEAKIISSPLNGKDEFDYLFGVSALAEIAHDLVLEEERHLFFEELENAANALRSVKDKITCVAVFLARCLRKTGMEFEVDCCAQCGSKKDIVAFDMSEGGFVCRGCINETTERDLTKNQLIYCRWIFSAKDYYNEWDDRFSKEDKVAVLQKMKNFVFDVLGANIQSLDCLL